MTEAMGGGIVSFISSIGNRQSSAGARVAVLYARRADTPPESDLRQRFGDRVELHPPVTGKSHLTRSWQLRRRLRAQMRSGDYDVVHLHSSIAGALGRTVRRRREDVLRVYSPHGFSFLREDKSLTNRWATEAAERAMARLDPLILTSVSEVEIARQRLRAKELAFLQSGVPRSSIVDRPHTPVQRLRVLMLGRVVYQKAPWRFAAVARALGHLADFVWVGAGNGNYPREWFADSPVQVLDWVAPEQLDDLLAQSAVFLFPTLWEGMSLSLIHAQSCGVPCVTTNVVGNRDAIVHGETGFVCDSDPELIEATRLLLEDPALRKTMREAAQRHARAALTDDEIGTASLELYHRWMSASR
ncbi:glycosyltransferase [Microbacterium sp. Sa4CUA7]|uniref:D-inositol 3-phosphate glycosyltransferase n=1 Tax=Microbacterium pullorum TaxID=2762236 RepID=A0ABR8S5B7_9MICO|nr:glycosyltransferase [Microbacterium pullorum]MBD7958579.1 glycosyltransferase [Microbacterium pullorum]